VEELLEGNPVRIADGQPADSGAAKEIEHQKKRRVIKDRADGPINIMNF